MTEALLQHIWQYQILTNQPLNLVDGEKVEVFDVGFKNENQGPDFGNSRIKIDGVEWNGNVELHIKSSDWFKHKHQHDLNYDNVILHIVLEYDKDVFRKNGEQIPTLELLKYIDFDFVRKYENLIGNETLFPCQNYISEVNEIDKVSLLERMLIERLERKTKLFNTWLIENNSDWEKTTFEVVAYCLGLKSNAQLFRELAHLVDYKKLLKHTDNRLQVEAILYGVSGLLKAVDVYSESLNQEYNFLKIKYNYTQTDAQLCKSHRMRPAALPTKRIAHLSNIFINNPTLFSSIKEQDVKGIKSIFSVDLKGYWAEHYDFGKKSTKVGSKLSDTTVGLILINGVVPLLYLYYKRTNQTEFLNKCFHILENLKSEKNNKIDLLKDYFSVKSAYDSQSVLELFDYNCSSKNCLRCSIFNKII